MDKHTQTVKGFSNLNSLTNKATTALFFGLSYYYYYYSGSVVRDYALDL